MKKVLTTGELKAIISLLDDSDTEVAEVAANRLFAEGLAVVPQLEEIWADSDTESAARIENLIQEIQHRSLSAEFTEWVNQGAADLLQAAILVCRIQYPGMQTEHVSRFLDQVRLDAWMAMYSTKNPLDRVKILNHILFERHGMTGNSDNYHAPDNSFIVRLIESKTANPITMSVLYCILAQRLGMPVFGVNLPQHFVLAWCQETEEQVSESFNSPLWLNRKDYGKVLFYINPFSQGQVFLKRNIDEFLEAIRVTPREQFYEPCSNLDILRRMLRNLHFSYSEIHNLQKVKEVEAYMRILGMDEEMNAED